MKTCKWIGRSAGRAVLLGVMLAASGSAMAATYNIILKDAGGTPLSCASGGFSFDKAGAGTFPASGSSVILAGCTLPFVPAIANGPYASATLSVVVENVTLDNPGTGGQIEPLDQGPNVAGLTGTLQYSTTAAGDCNGEGADTALKTYTISYSYTPGSQNAAGRTYTISCAGPGQDAFTLGTGQYHVRNLANPVPEPGSLWLALVGTSALVLSRRLRRRG